MRAFVYIYIYMCVCVCVCVCVCQCMCFCINAYICVFGLVWFGFIAYQPLLVI